MINLNQIDFKYKLGGLIAAALLIAGIWFGVHALNNWIEAKLGKHTPAITNTVERIQQLPPQVIHTTTETVREVAVQAPSQPGAILQIVERDGKVIAKVGDQEVEVPNQIGQPSVKLGENGELRISTASTAEIDVTDMANAQAQLIAQQAMDEQSAEFKKEMDKEKAARKRERILWVAGTAAAGYFFTR